VRNLRKGLAVLQRLESDIQRRELLDTRCSRGLCQKALSLSLGIAVQLGRPWVIAKCRLLGPAMSDDSVTMNSENDKAKEERREDADWYEPKAVEAGKGLL
jgi:hypothetical protein